MSDEQQCLAYEIYARLTKAAKKHGIKVLCKTTSNMWNNVKTTIRLRPGHKMDMSAFEVEPGVPLRQSVDLRLSGYGDTTVENKKFTRGESFEWLKIKYVVKENDQSLRGKDHDTRSVPPINYDNLDMLDNLVKVVKHVFLAETNVGRSLYAWDHDTSRVQWQPFTQEEYAGEISEHSERINGQPFVQVSLTYTRQAIFMGTGFIKNHKFTLVKPEDLQKENKDPELKLAFLFRVAWQDSSLGVGQLCSDKTSNTSLYNHVVYDGKSYCLVDDVSMFLSDKKPRCQLNKHDKHLLDMTMRFCFEEKSKKEEQTTS